MGSTDLVLREMYSSDRPLRESETHSVDDGANLDYLMRQHTPWYRHVHVLDHSVAPHVAGHYAFRRESPRTGEDESSR